MQYLLFIQYVSRKGDPFMRLSLVLCWVFFFGFFYLCFGVSQLTEVIAEAIGMGGWGDEINAHFKLRSFLISYFQTWHCVFTAAGAHCQLSLSHLQIEIDLPDREPRARGWTLSDAEELPVRHFVTWSLVDCLFILQKTLWCDAEGEMLALCHV